MANVVTPINTTINKRPDILHAVYLRFSVCEQDNCKSKQQYKRYIVMSGVSHPIFKSVTPCSFLYEQCLLSSRKTALYSFKKPFFVSPFRAK